MEEGTVHKSCHTFCYSQKMDVIPVRIRYPVLITEVVDAEKVVVKYYGASCFCCAVVLENRKLPS